MYLFMFIYGSIKLKHNIIILISKLLPLNKILYYTRTIFRVYQFMCVISFFLCVLCFPEGSRKARAPRQLLSLPRRKFGPDGIAFWGNAFDSHIKKLHITINCLVKYIFNKPILFPTTVLYNECKILNIKSLHIEHVFAVVFKYINRISIQL